MGKKRLLLEEEEAVLTSDCSWGCHEVSRMPYGELGNVREARVCCCVGFSSNLTPGDGGLGKTIIPGNCCETALVAEIVRNLKARMKDRGDTGQIQRAEENVRQIQHLHAKIDALMERLQVAAVPMPIAIDRK